MRQALRVADLEVVRRTRVSRMNKTESIIVRCATEHDAVAIARLSTDLGYPVSVVVMQARILAISASSSDLLIVAVNLSGETIGWLQAHSAHLIESGFRVEITGLVVSPIARRSGIGRSLVTTAERWAVSLNAELIVVRSSITRVESRVFYPTMGYCVTKTSHVYQKSLHNNLTPMNAA